MAAAPKCWSSRTTTDEDMVEQVLMRTHDRFEGFPDNSDFGPAKTKQGKPMQKWLQKLGQNVSKAIASLKNSLNLNFAHDQHLMPTAAFGPTKAKSCREVVWGTVVRNLTQLYPRCQLPEKLVSNIRKHYDSLPLRLGVSCC